VFLQAQVLAGLTTVETVAYQLASANGSSLFPPSAYPTATFAATPANLKVGVTETKDLALGLKYTHAIARMALGFFQPVTDLNTIVKNSLTDGFSLIPASFLAVTPLLGLIISSCTYTGAKNYDGTTAAPFTTPPVIGTLSKDFVVAEMACNWAIPLLALGCLIKPPSPSSSAGDYVMVLTQLIATGDFALTVAADVLEKADSFALATHILERTPSSDHLRRAEVDVGVGFAAGGMLLKDAVKATP
jgi:hypothetical protein